MKIARLGYRPELGDARDHAYVRTAAALPASVDLRGGFMPPIWDQGDYGSCVWHGAPRVLMFARARAGKPIPMPSRMAGYYETRKIEGDTRQDAGCEIRDAIKVLAKLGVPPETEWPYDQAHFAKAPTAKVLADGQQDIITSYQRLSTLDDMLDCLASGFPFAAGITVYESFESDGVADSGKVLLPAHDEQPIGGHCIAVVGYTSTTTFLCANSWGTGWGQKGYFEIPAAYLGNPNLCTDVWTIRA